MNKRKNSPNSIVPWCHSGHFFYSLSKHNRYLRSVLQGIHQAVIVIYGYTVDHSVPQLFVKLDGWSFKTGLGYSMMNPINLLMPDEARPPKLVWWESAFATKKGYKKI